MRQVRNTSDVLRSMNREQIHLVRAHFRAIKPARHSVALAAMRSMAGRYPGLASFLDGRENEVAVELVQIVRTLVYSIDRYHEIEGPLLELGKRHALRGVKADHYAIFREHWLAALEEVSADGWTQELAGSWRLFLETVSGVLIRGGFPAVRKAA